MSPSAFSGTAGFFPPPLYCIIRCVLEKEITGQFEIVARDAQTKARRGVLHLAHGDVETPAFMPVGPQAGVPQSLDGSLKYVIGAPAMSMKDLAAITLAPKMIAKLKAEVKALKERLGQG